MASRICVTLPADSVQYDIQIADGVLQSLPSIVGQCRAVIITNPTLLTHYQERLRQLLPDATCITMQDGEQHKNLETVAHLYEGCFAAGLDRAGKVIAFGGGVVGDTAGYVAATFMRGIAFIQVPTSLLSMVDSSVGGKVGVDHPQGKNLIGAFKQPDTVLIDPTVLKTLPDREWRCGMAEVIKHGFLADPELLNLALWGKSQAAELVTRAVQVKVDVVQQDPYEATIRAHLNLGHTFGHAIEKVSEFAWPHGEAVGVGLVCAAHLSYRLNLCSASLVDTVTQVVQQVGLPTRIGDLDPQAINTAMSTDKKRKSGKLRFVVLHGVGQPAMVDDVPQATVLDVLRSLQ
jgi:3-dehydroquinate synthase